MPVGSWVLSDLIDGKPHFRVGDLCHQCLSALGFCQTSHANHHTFQQSPVTNACRLLGFVRPFPEYGEAKAAARASPMPVGSWVLSDEEKHPVRGCQWASSPMPVGSWVLSDNGGPFRKYRVILGGHQCLSALGFCQTGPFRRFRVLLGKVLCHQCLSALGFCQT